MAAAQRVTVTRSVGAWGPHGVTATAWVTAAQGGTATRDMGAWGACGRRNPWARRIPLRRRTPIGSSQPMASLQSMRPPQPIMRPMRHGVATTHGDDARCGVVAPHDIAAAYGAAAACGAVSPWSRCSRSPWRRGMRDVVSSQPRSSHPVASHTPTQLQQSRKGATHGWGGPTECGAASEGNRVWLL